MNEIDFKFGLDAYMKFFCHFSWPVCSNELLFPTKLELFRNFFKSFFLQKFEFVIFKISVDTGSVDIFKNSNFQFERSQKIRTINFNRLNMRLPEFYRLSIVAL